MTFVVPGVSYGCTARMAQSSCPLVTLCQSARPEFILKEEGGSRHLPDGNEAAGSELVIIGRCDKYYFGEACTTFLTTRLSRISANIFSYKTQTSQGLGEQGDLSSLPQRAAVVEVKT